MGIDYNKLKDLAVSVLKLSRNTLIMHMRFMDSAVSRLTWVPVPELVARYPELKLLEDITIATEGTALLYNPIAVCRLYAAEKELGPRAYMHMVMHCIFRHFMVGPTVDRDLWDLACDMAVESAINGLNQASLCTKNVKEQSEELDCIAPEVNYLLTAEKIYNWLKWKNLPETRLTRLRALFAVDVHKVWYLKAAELTLVRMPGMEQTNEWEYGKGEGQGSEWQGVRASALEQDWRDVSERMQLEMETFLKLQGNAAGNMLQNLRAVNREQYDYASFLKKFAVMGEAMKINHDEFDYVFYTYGMKLFPEKRMPLIEPLEYKEVKRIKEFVIAIDTSGSVMGEQVQSFLQKTYNILKSTESFFSRINLHIFQCDAEIQEHVKITKQDEFDEYLKHMRIRGLGGTDFRPVFASVNRMIREQEFGNLKGLIYFTDGYGVFPERKPDYETAFVFVRDGYEIPQVPVWAIRLVLDRADLDRI